MPRVARPLAERFNEKVDRSGGHHACHLWTGGKDGVGYGRISVPPRSFMAAHRLSWELASGQPIPDGLWVLHRCDVRACVNPAHLFLGTVQDNHDDMWAKGRGPAGARRQNQPKGERHHNHKLTEAGVVEIRRLAAGGMRTGAIAARYDMTPGNIRKVVRGDAWAMVEKAKEESHG